MTAVATFGTTSDRRPMALFAVLALISLPAMLVLFEAVNYNVQNRNNGMIVSSGQEREYLLYVPKSYVAARQTPLVISMHPGGGWPAAQQEISQWNGVADQHGFIVVYPSGIKGAGPTIWRMDGGAGLTADVRFIADLIDKLEAEFNIDKARVYADGLSNGGGMAFVLSCTLADRIAAVGMVASAQLLPWRWCKDPRPMPMITFHGTADPETPYNGGKTWVAPVSFPSIPTWTANWARRNRCGTNPTESAVANDVSRLEYTNCAENASVVFYTIKGGGHSWPGGGPLPAWLVGSTSNSVDASGLMWAFFKEHRRYNR